MKNKLLVIFFMGIFVPSVLYAETLVLKSGKEIPCRVIEKTADYVKVEFEGKDIYYENKYVKEIKDDNYPGQQSNIKERYPEENDFILKKALEYGSQGNFLDARKELEKASADSDPNIRGALDILDSLDKGEIGSDYALNLFKGSYALMQQDYPAAIASLEKILSLSKDDMDVYYNLGVAYYYSGDFNKAIEYLNKLLQLNPEDPETCGLIGNAYYMKGEYDKAKENFIIARDLFRRQGDTYSAEEVESLLNEISKKEKSS